MYFHGGSRNHGCEAIVRSTANLLGGKMVLYSSNIEEDIDYGIDRIVELKSDEEKRIGFFRKLYSAVAHKMSGDDYIYVTLEHSPFFSAVNRGDIYLSIGGDNYCYQGRDVLRYYNKKIHKKGAKTVLWGCSVDPEDITDAVAGDLARYDLIVAREGITFNALQRINKNTILIPDPAFSLETKETILPDGFIPGKMIGINVSPLIGSYGDISLILNNYRKLIKGLLEKSENSIALIPHVVTPGSDDRTVLNVLYSEYKDSGRVILVPDMNCEELKYIISQCEIMVGARTHATIAAYSSCVPTLVVGYSVKSIGIARELFGTDEHYVVPVQALKTEDDLEMAYNWIFERRIEIREYLQKKIPQYISDLYKIKEIIKKL